MARNPAKLRSRTSFQKTEGGLIKARNGELVFDDPVFPNVTPQHVKAQINELRATFPLSVFQTSVRPLPSLDLHIFKELPADEKVQSSVVRSLILGFRFSSWLLRQN
eukprot:TRINITY_DN5856_c0_g1_i1.p1 TRINITY_DN5856_c0_g1~~TRINITY_DN5856_c0_g1_i1.p1  ORF type:complete len:107 (-),score=7.70 TRINITY_DN5856_c0_g1_i1:55-375(-)